MTRQILSAAVAAVLAAAVPGLAAAKKRQRDSRRRASHVTLHLPRHNILSGHRALLQGKVRPSGGHRLKIVVRGGGGEVIRAHSRADGRFRLGWRPARAGNYTVRAFSVHDRLIRAAVSPPRRLTSYRPAVASYYGPGLYGNGVACGGTLRPDTLGVANKTLPCGTRVRLRYHGRSVTVPVIDRGPYVAGRDYDLTEATRRRLGFPGVGVLLSSR